MRISLNIAEKSPGNHGAGKDWGFVTRFNRQTWVKQMVVYLVYLVYNGIESWDWMLGSTAFNLDPEIQGFSGVYSITQDTRHFFHGQPSDLTFTRWIIQQVTENSPTKRDLMTIRQNSFHFFDATIRPRFKGLVATINNCAWKLFYPNCWEVPLIPCPKLNLQLTCICNPQLMTRKHNV